MEKIYELNGKMYQEPVKKGFDYENAVEVMSPIREDGTIILSHPLAKDLPKKEDGTFYKKYNEDLTVDIDYEREQMALAFKVEVRAAIAKSVETIIIEVDGNVYQGNEVSTGRMGRAINTLVGDETIQWKMYNNEFVTVTQTELKKAMRKAGILQSKLWFCKSTEEIKNIVQVDSQWLIKYNQ